MAAGVIAGSFLRNEKEARTVLMLQALCIPCLFFAILYADFQNMLLPKEWVDLVELC